MKKLEDDKKNSKALWHLFHKQVERKAARKLKARQEKKNIWFALGMFGMVGWSVTIPALLCIALGVWIDTQFASRYSWTLMLLFVGVVLGCLNAWYWIEKESKRD
ncbi:MAG: ATP synthase subunit [Moorea sp. SIO4E2]|uniref:AtpZ/AtpI family protein n=1 Tax=Moorena sp. SIO4E2 TaxID=2607826 RepID=UPI0013BC004A|nr:AtpZ/AtpI family protein [Moorena sp. SIO4E2]NEQ08171.1 ATP synthase subunit [Moorena sp. SIO4E2]